MNAAKFLNGDLAFDINDLNQKTYYIKNISDERLVLIAASEPYSDGQIFFKSAELARQAIDILGEETIKSALNTDW